MLDPITPREIRQRQLLARARVRLAEAGTGQLVSPWRLARLAGRLLAVAGPGHDDPCRLVVLGLRAAAGQALARGDAVAPRGGSRLVLCSGHIYVELDP